MRKSHFITLALFAAVLSIALIMAVSCSSAGDSSNLLPDQEPLFRFIMAGEIPGYVTINTDTVYNSSTGFGWLDNAAFGTLRKGSNATSDRLRGSFIQGVVRKDGEDNPVTGVNAVYTYPTFVVDLPPGIYDVRLVIGRTVPNVAGAKIEGVFNAVPYFTGSLPDNSSAPSSSQLITGRRFTDTVFRTAVLDGQLTIELAGNTPMLNALEIYPVPAVERGDKPTVHVVGDSHAIVVEGPVPTRIPHQLGDILDAGWGISLEENFAGLNINRPVKNDYGDRASARSYISEGFWNQALVSAKPGDYILINWGQNDAVTSLINHFSAPDEFKSVLKRYVNDAKALQVTPILITPFNQNTFNERGQVLNASENWSDKMRELAREEGLLLVDVARVSQNHLQEIGPLAARRLFTNGNTILTRPGAVIVGREIGDVISVSNLPLAAFAYPKNVDRDGLRLAIASAQVKNESLYSPASFRAFRDVWARVEAMPANMNQAGYNSAAAMLNNAINALVRLPDPEYTTPPRQMEWLDRGLYAMHVPNEGVFLSWRYLGTDHPSVTFNLYRNGVRITTTPLTNFTDRAGNESSIYTVSAVTNGVEVMDPRPVRTIIGGYLRIPLDKPEGGTTISGPFEYEPNDASVGDVDGDGQYEIFVKWEPTNARDNSHSGHTGSVLIDCYTLEGKRLWRIDLGPNIRAGAHYTQFMVYDFDGTGRAKLICRTSDGTVDGLGNVIGAAGRRHAADSGHVLDAPEFLTLFCGLTGAALDTVPYDPPYSAVRNWGDNWGNRGFRFLACVAYLDGVNPSVVMARGYYTQTFLISYRVIDNKLVKGPLFRSTAYRGPLRMEGQGNHSIAVMNAGVDGKDIVIFGAAAFNSDLSALHSTGFGHGDANHQGNLDPLRPGQEVFTIHEGSWMGLNMNVRDAFTGEILWGVRYPDADLGRCLAGDFDPRYPGFEVFTSAAPPAPTGEFNPYFALYSAQGKIIPEALGAPRPGANFSIWWDGTLQREILDHIGYTPTIWRWNWKEGKLDEIVRMHGTLTNNGTKANVMLQADILGDWREEVLVREVDGHAMRLYMTTFPTEHRLPTLMHDPNYRNAIAWQNVAYNQPPHVGFYLGHGMDLPPQPNIFTAPAPGRDTPVRTRTATPSVFIAGDSTAQAYDSSARVYDPAGTRAPLAGWGQTMDRFFKPRLVFRNFAATGSSTRSFIADGRLNAILREIRPGDYMLIQFGQNDAAQNVSVNDFRTNLMRFVEGARQNGAIPVIVTPVNRLDFTGNRLNVSFAQFVDAAKAVASENNVAIIDLNQLSRDFVEGYGADRAARELFQADRTNLRLKGAIEVSRLLSGELVRVIPALSAHAGNEMAELNPPGVPAGFRVVNAGNGQARVSWSPNPLASFAVYLRESTQSDFRLAGEQSGNSFTFNNLENGRDYFVRVRAFNQIGISDFTSELRLEIRQMRPQVNEDFETREAGELPWQTVGNLSQAVTDAPAGNGTGRALRIQGGQRFGQPRGFQLNMGQEIEYDIVEVSFDWYPGRPSDGVGRMSIQDAHLFPNQFITFIANQRDNRVYVYLGNKEDDSNLLPAARGSVQIGRTLNTWVRVRVLLNFTNSTLTYELRNTAGRVLRTETNIPFAPDIDYNRRVSSLHFSSMNAPAWSSWIDNLYIGEVRR
jgi:rhamnogalacturonan exolyase